MATMKLTQVYLEAGQKKGLQAKAKANGTKVAEEVRRAVDAYLSGISSEDLGLLDEGTRKAQVQLVEMANELDRVNAALDAAFAQLSRTERKPRRAA
jgi:2-methylisocitrate lyase-like PEP mutase family enzyme